jgi:hypothetical protein
MRIAKQIANHAHVPRIRKFHQGDQVGAAFFQCTMDRMPHPLEGVHLTASSALVPAEVA